MSIQSNILLEVLKVNELTKYNKMIKRNKKYKDWKERKLSLFPQTIGSVYKNSKEWVNINNFSELAGYTLNIQKSTGFNIIGRNLNMKKILNLTMLSKRKKIEMDTYWVTLFI